MAHLGHLVILPVIYRAACYWSVVRDVLTAAIPGSHLALLCRMPPKLTLERAYAEILARHALANLQPRCWTSCHRCLMHQLFLERQYAVTDDAAQA